jgi:hypothetical protein
VHHIAQNLSVSGDSDWCFFCDYHVRLIVKSNFSAVVSSHCISFFNRCSHDVIFDCFSR